MRAELSIAVNFVLSFLYNRLPRRRVNLIGEQLFSALSAKFEGHWYPEQPVKGTAYRSLKISGEQSDPMIVEAARETGLDVLEVVRHLPQNLTLWIDPGEVSCRVGEKGPVTTLYSSQNEQPQDVQQQLLQEPQWAYQQQLQQQPQPQQQQQQLSANCFTASDFAQTKFGSTKLRQPPRSRMQPYQPRLPNLAWDGIYEQQYQQQLQQLQQQQYEHLYSQQHLPLMQLHPYNTSTIWSCTPSYTQLSIAIPATSHTAAASGKVGSSGYGSNGSSGHSSPLLMSK